MKQQLRNKAGFTLVELIVVIAILGILAGIGTVGYSGYVKRANMAVDQQLVSDIKYAIQLAYLSDADSFAGNQVMVLSMDNAPYYSGGDALSNAVTAAFGNSDSQRLKYNGWTDTSTMLENIGESNPYAASVGESSYIQNVGTTKLLGDVQDCATALGGFLDRISSDKNEAGNMLQGYLGDSLGELLTNSGVATKTTAENGTVIYDYSNASKEDLSNATVFCLANYLNDSSKQNYVENMFSVEYGVGLNEIGSFIDGSSADMLYETACWYAAMEGFVSYLDDDACTAAFEGIDMSSNNALTILGQMGLAQQTITGYINAQYPEDPDADISEYGPLAQKTEEYYFTQNSDGKTQAQLDAEGFLGVMNTVNNLAGDYTNKSSMGNGSLFASGDMVNRLDSFVAASSLSNAEDLATIKSKAAGSSIVIVVANGSMSVCPAGALIS